MRKLVISLIGAFSAVAASGGAAAQSSSDETERPPVAVEMFISQACKSCPPAAAYLSELARRPDVVALGWHIDYWNMLSNRKYGRWEDPFSRAAFSDRQRRYNRNIRGRGTVFTPQAIINGAESAVGSKRNNVEAMIEAERKVPEPATIEFVSRDDAYAVRVTEESGPPCTAYLVKFRRSASTDVKGGDNAGVRFEEANVVSELVPLGEVTMHDDVFTVPRPENGMGCAVLVQEHGQGRIVAARYCPAA